MTQFFLVSQAVLSQEVDQLQLDNLRLSVQANTQAIYDFEQILRDFSDNNDRLEKNNQDINKQLEQLQQRFLILETTIRGIEEKLLNIVSDATNNTTPIASGEAEDSTAATFSANEDIMDSNLFSFGYPLLDELLDVNYNDQQYLDQFSAQDEQLSESAMFSTAYTFRNIGQFLKARGYFEQFRQQYPSSELFNTSLFLSGLSAYVMDDFEACSNFLGRYLAVAEDSNLDQTKWLLGNCLLNQNHTQAAKVFFQELAADQSSSYKAEAQQKLAE